MAMTTRMRTTALDTSDYVDSWAKRIVANAPKDETPEDVLALINRERYLNRGRWAAYVIRLGAANERLRKKREAKDTVVTKLFN